MILARCLAPVSATPAIHLKPGLIITRSCKVARQGYRLPSGGDEPGITVKGDGITVDFDGAQLLGSAPSALPDSRSGLGILVLGKHVTIKNVGVHGYKVGLKAVTSDGLKVWHSDLSYNWKQHLKSTPERENESDWQSFHHNEHDEWLRYGAGIYLSLCKDFQVKDVQIEGGQCGLVLNRCEHGLVQSNNFSFLSGVGLGLYRTSHVLVANNRIDWCVRGFSHGVYNRGQDSAGILVFEQSNNNLITGNSVTHGGDGFFLWAGQTTMDTGQGGCNDNLLVGNDFSHAVTNGIEATFSRNAFKNNKVLECWHGLWGGFSYDSEISGNLFGDDGTGVAIEHGQRNQIGGNFFSACDTGVDLWSDPITQSDWGYPKHRDTDSKSNVVSGNRFKDIGGWAIDLRDSENSYVKLNTFSLCRGEVRELRKGTVVLGLAGSKAPTEIPLLQKSGLPAPEAFKGQENYLRRFLTPRWTGNQAGTAFLPAGTLRGQRYILVDEWGPYDFKRPLLQPREDVGQGRKSFEVLGPPGRWRLQSSQGFSGISPSQGQVPGSFVAEVDSGQAGTSEINLIYRGAETVDFRGLRTAAGVPVRFGYSKFSVPAAWEVKFFRWFKSKDPSDPHSPPLEADGLFNGKPLLEAKLTSLDLAGSALMRGLPNNHYATLATGEFKAPAGAYEFDLTTDDGARVWLDGSPLFADAWKYQGPQRISKR